MSDLICVLHPKHIDEYFSVTEDGHIIHCRYCQSEPVRNFGEVSSLLTYYKIEHNMNHETKEVVALEDKQAPYKGGYLGEIIWPWFSVFQEHGTNGCVCNLETGAIKLFSRENHHCKYSCFSAALFIYRQHVCLLHQTLWNRLDITDLQSGELLTDAEKEEDLVDYFHGRVSFSPDYRYFVDTGWVWAPDGLPYVYRVENFLKEYEHTRISFYVQGDYLYGEGWDQYAVWFDANTFALDFPADEDILEEIDRTLLPKNHQSIFMTFSMENVKQDEHGMYVEAQVTEKLPLSTMCIRPFNESMKVGKGILSKDYCPTLYYDRKEELLISIDKNHVAMWQKPTGKTYNFVYDGSGAPDNSCFYSKEHHAIYGVPSWNGSYTYAELKDIISKLEEGCKNGSR